MNELPPHAKQLLALARSADEPDDAARERVRRGVALAVGMGSAAAAGAASKAASASASAAGAGAAKVGAGSSVAVKLVIAGAVTAALGAGAWQWRATQVAHERVASQPVVHAPSAAPKPVPAEPPAAPATPLVQEPPAAPGAERAQNAAAEQPLRTPAEPRRPRDAETAKPPNTLHAEMTLLQAASTALDHGDLPRARELLKAHRQAHASGQLRAERRGLEVLLQCIAREAGAGVAARAYLRSEPDGVLSARITAACKAEPLQ